MQVKLEQANEAETGKAFSEKVLKMVG